MVSNGTLARSGDDAQSLEPWVLHLGPSEAGLGADIKTSIWWLQTAPREVLVFPSDPYPPKATQPNRLGFPIGEFRSP